MDWTLIVVGVLSLIGTAIGSFVGNNATKKIVEYRLEQLESEVYKHNNFIERLTLNEQSTKSAHQRIDDIVKHER